ncbi:VCBS repeat-containing protein [Clostridium sp. SYSU_GA19001]|uniref:FG-GAP repeat domain-containing protein n=1 Tax=Clostridium caldaquaticum TaxID=2940653 RepID=UPI002076E341|nr:VCBS repeat-containing protein [Clostridium caldaquaticum]MCM8709552.1 VCBS repeat-containing protein [Clostridium caldaquaticum]
MKKNIIIPAIFLALFILPFNNIKAAEEEKFKIDTEFSTNKLKLRENTFILDYKYEDVTGDNIKDDILLLGHKNSNTQNTWSDDIYIILQDGKSNRYSKFSIGKINYGYNSKMFLGDFNGDKVDDIFVKVCNGKETGAYYSLISLIKNKALYLFEQKKFSLGIPFDINYVDDFKVNIFCKDINKSYTTDVSNKKNIYINSEVYNSIGEVLKETKGIQSSLEELHPIDIDKDGVYELKGVQKLRGFCYADVVGYAKSIWKYDGSKMKLIKLDITSINKSENIKNAQNVLPVGIFKN